MEKQPENITMQSIDDLPEAVSRIMKLTENHRIFAVSGDLGAGKTTLIKAVCRELGVKENMSSPSFSIINEYRKGNGAPVFHIDCYRLKNTEEAHDIGMEEYFSNEHLCFIEWPEIVNPLLPEEHVGIELIILPGNSRQARIWLQD